METACPVCNNPFIIPSRPPVNPVPVKRELKLPPRTASVVVNNFENGQQTPPYFGPQPGGCSAPSAIRSSWRKQPAAPPVNPFLRPFVNCLKTAGRASRLEYNLFVFITYPVLVLLFCLLLGGISCIAPGLAEFLPLLIYPYCFFWSMPIIVRRFHDFGYNGMHYLLLLLPIFNIIMGLELIFRPSDPEENAFGPRP